MLRVACIHCHCVQNGGNDGKKSERGLEYDTMSDRLARFIGEEVVPAVLARPEIKAAFPKFAFTKNPWGHAVMGCSSGGAAALTMGWFRPDLFRRVIAYSGTFVDQQDDDAPEEARFPFGAWEYHSGMKLIESSEKKPLRIFTHVSEHDIREQDPEETHHNWVMAGKRTSAALEAKGYDHRFVFSLATGHCEGKVFEQTLADTLVWIWRGYHDEPSATPAEQYQQLLKACEVGSPGRVLSDEERTQFIGHAYKVRYEVALRFVELAEKYPTDPIARESLTQAVWQVNTTPWPVELVGK